MPFIRPTSSTPALPSWLGAIGQWSEIPSSALTSSSAGWSGTSPGGSGPYTEVLNAWGDMIVNTKGLYVGAIFIPGVWLVFHGGGHGNWGGNEVYAYGPIDTDSPAWHRLRDPTVPGPNGTSVGGEDASGNPTSTHTYRTLVYMGNGTSNGMLRIGADALYPDANGSVFTHYFDFTVASPNTNQPWSKKANAIGAADVHCYDRVNNNIWSHSNNLAGNGNNIQFYDADTDTYSSGSFLNPSFTSFTATAALDTARNIWAIIGDTGLNFVTITSTFGAFSGDYTIPTVSGTAPNSGGRPGFVYDSVDDRFVAWDDGGKKLWFLKNTAGSWAWTNSTPASGAVPSAGDARGVYGRFALVNINGARCYVLVPQASSSVFVYRAG